MSSDPAQGMTMPAVTATTMSLPGVGARPWVLPLLSSTKRCSLWPCCIRMVSCDRGCPILLVGWPWQSCQWHTAQDRVWGAQFSEGTELSVYWVCSSRFVQGISQLHCTHRCRGHTFVPPWQWDSALQCGPALKPLSHRCRGARVLPGCAPANVCAGAGGGDSTGGTDSALLSRQSHLSAPALQLRYDFILWLLYTARHLSDGERCHNSGSAKRARHALPSRARRRSRCPRQSTWAAADLSPAGWKSPGSYSWGRGIHQWYQWPEV